MVAHHHVLLVNFPQAIHSQRFPTLGIIFSALVLAVMVYLVYTLVGMFFEASAPTKARSAIRARKSAVGDAVSATDSISAVRRW